MTEADYRAYIKQQVKKPSTIDHYVNYMRDFLQAMLVKVHHGSYKDPFDAFADPKDLLNYLNSFLSKGPNHRTLFSEKLKKSSGCGSAVLKHYVNCLAKIAPNNQNNIDYIKKILDLRRQYNQNNNSINTFTQNVTGPTSSSATIHGLSNEDWSHQIIFYGAPGTGKSRKIRLHLDDKNVSENNIFRITFHPDYDYAAFVGALKPKMRTRTDGHEYISYEFVPGVFTKAYIRAKMTDENVYLIIEEINRGNCAAIFGDLFQLLDRKDGVSEYPIDVDPDLSDYIFQHKGKEVESDAVDKDGSSNMVKLSLPKNLYIWATMNTSDQSLFPIDAAFKRRWKMQYMKNEKRNPDVIIKVNGKDYKINDIIKSINKILKDNHLEDKEVGYYFLKDNELETEECLVDKLIHYLYHDVYKPFGHPSVFKMHPFDDLYIDDRTIDSGKLEQLLKDLDIDGM